MSGFNPPVIDRKRDAGGWGAVKLPSQRASSLGRGKHRYLFYFSLLVWGREEGERGKGGSFKAGGLVSSLAII